MEKIQFPRSNKHGHNDFFSKLNIEELPEPGGKQSKIPGLSNKAFSVIKFLLGILMLPFVYSSTVAFLKEFMAIDALLRRYFWIGVVSFVITHLFILEPVKVYQKGQKLLEIIFQFFAPLVKVAPYVMPVYSIIIACLYLLLALFMKSSELVQYFMVSFGFTMAFHLAFSAKTLRAKQDFFKASYIFGFSFVYMLNIAIMSLFFNLIFEKFSFVNFFNNGFQIASAIFSAIFRQLFKT